MGTMGPHPEAVARTSAAARTGRSDVDRALLADPERGRAANVEMLARGGEECERFLRAGFEASFAAYSRRDWELNTLFLDRDHVFRPGARALLPDMRDEYHGIAGYLESQELLSSSWANLTATLVDLAARDDERVLTVLTFAGTGAGSGLPLEWQAYGQYTIRDGLAVEQTHWWDRALAEQALGVALPGLEPRER